MFVLGVVDDQHLVLLPLYLLLQVDVVVGRFHQADSKVSGDYYVHDVYLLNYHSVDLELLHQFFLKVVGKLCFDISYFGDSLLFNKISDSFIALLLKKLLKSVRSKVVKEFLDIFLLVLRFQSADMEVDSHIDCDPHIILGRNICYRAFVPDRVLGDHCHNFSGTAPSGVAASEPRSHDSSILSKNLLQSEDSIGDIEFPNAAWLISDDGHYWDSLSVMFGYLMRSLFDIVAVKLNQPGSWPELSLELVVLLNGPNSVCAGCGRGPVAVVENLLHLLDMAHEILLV